MTLRDTIHELFICVIRGSYLKVGYCNLRIMNTGMGNLYSTFNESLSQNTPSIGPGRLCLKQYHLFCSFIQQK